MSLLWASRGLLVGALTLAVIWTIGILAGARASTRSGLVTGAVALAVLSGRRLRIALRCHNDALQLANLADHETIAPSELHEGIRARRREC